MSGAPPLSPTALPVDMGGIEPHTRIVAQGLTPCCDQIVTVFQMPEQSNAVSETIWLLLEYS